MGSLVWVKSDDGNAQPQLRERGKEGILQGAETPAVYTRPRMESYIRDPGQAAPAGQLRGDKTNGESRLSRQRRESASP
jgi:hypothetical protein